MLMASREDMRELEAEIQRMDGLDEAQMIRNAGSNAANAICRWCEEFPEVLRRRFAVLAGAGNNGADAWICADCLHKAGRDVLLIDCHGSRRFSPGAQKALEYLMDNPPFPVLGFEETMASGALADLLEPGTVVVDGLVGIGLKSPLRAPFSDIVEAIGKLNVPIVSLDIPSGLDAETGECGQVMHADLTLSMGFVKRGCFLGRGPECCGQLQILAFGKSDAPLNAGNRRSLRERFFAFGRDEAAALLGPRPQDCHKFSLGRVLIMAGSIQYCGAPFLAAAAALRSGCGLVTLMLPEAARKRQADAALIVNALSGASRFEAKHTAEVKAALAKTDAILYGPGVSTEAAPEILQLLLNAGKPLVLDADGLRILAAHPELLPEDKSALRLTLTPHGGEMAALLDAFAPNAKGLPREEQALELARVTGAVVVLKGPKTVVATGGASPQCSFNVSGNPALATAGSGDVLAGMIGAFSAQMSLRDAARLGVYLHGLAADVYARGNSPRGLVADDLPLLLPLAMRECVIW